LLAELTALSVVTDCCPGKYPEDGALHFGEISLLVLEMRLLTARGSWLVMSQSNLVVGKTLGKGIQYAVAR